MSIVKINVATNQLIITCCVDFLPKLQAIYVFGSQLTEFANADSDIDIAVLCEQSLSSEQRWDLSNKLAQLLRCDVDVTDLKSANTVMQFQVINTGERIFCKDSSAQAFFETYVCSDYIRLNEQRRGILEDIKKRGSIYG